MIFRIESDSKSIYFLTALFWTVAISTSMWWSLYLINSKIEDTALSRAEFVFNTIETTRLWNARHGGVYVKLDGQTEPNPYLLLSDRDLTSVDGTELTMINPSYMTREIVELAKEINELDMHLTSLKLRNPNNEADEWEKKQLLAFEQGKAFSREFFDNKNYFRYMKPLKVDASCLKCHADQDYKVGDIRGGLSVSFDMSNIINLESKQKVYMIAMHIIAWVTLITFSFFFITRSKRYIKDIEISKNSAEDLVKVRTKDLQKFLNATQFSPAAITITDRDGLVEYINPKFSEITGYTLDELVGKSVDVLNSDNILDEQVKDMWKHIRDKKEWCGEWQSKAKNGHEYWQSLKISPILDEYGDIVNFVAVGEDITAQKYKQSFILHQSNHDTLTDLPNRKYLKELVEEMLTRLKGKNKELALLYIDLDGFKPINDTLGHAAGDILLKELALRLKKIVRGSDIVARLGGDEFVVVLASGVNKSGAGLVAKNILDCIAKPFYLEDDNTPSYVTASIGIAFSKNLSYKELLENGDSAMYEAKHSGKNRFVFFEDIVKK